MVAMGGGPDLPSRGGASKEKELVLCALPWPEEEAERGIKALKEAFEDVDVKYYHSKFENGKPKLVDVPDGKLEGQGADAFSWYWDPEGAVWFGVTTSLYLSHELVVTAYCILYVFTV
jgi:hypothetical protein